MPKNIVICCDGTWNRFDRGDRTNVTKLCYCLERQQSGQVVFYDPGVGTVAAASARTAIERAWSRLLGGAFGFGLKRNLEEAYSFLMQHYAPGDHIFLFGFSRGAWCVRALGAILKLYGLLERGNENLFPYVFEMVTTKRNGSFDFGLAAEFKATFARAVPIHFVGVWDTVSSVGWVTTPFMMPFTRSNDTIAHIRHAVAIDERRKNFRPNLINPQARQDTKEVWFAGAHADVGGGYPERESASSKLALEWMLREAQSVDPPLLVDDMRKHEILGGKAPNVAPDAGGPLHNALDSWLWRVLQLFPRRSFRFVDRQPPEPHWDWSWRARPRTLPSTAVLHASVPQRMRDGQYQPANVDHSRSYAVEP